MMDVWSLASGSSGNAYLIRSGETVVLVECGISVRRLVQELGALRLDPRRLSAVFLTHAHSDHLGSARDFSDRFGVPVLATAGTLSHPALQDAGQARALVPGASVRVGEVEAFPFRVPHDCLEPVGYRFDGPQGAICVLTDLGTAPESVVPLLADVDLLILEANHDLEMLHNGPYPARLKRRVAGELGHLSNAAAAGLVARASARPPEAIWLAHLSLVNNAPALAQRTVASRLAEAGLGHIPVQVAARNRRSLHWSSIPRIEQLPLL
ncbi:MAG: MBL fold metallo-hydrolase [Chloroflexi bacterium]|nr:MBL fold metallo-hydrolase [Chloroflexota bacterium]